jgi:hypothetical protein
MHTEKGTWRDLDSREERAGKSVKTLARAQEEIAQPVRATEDDTTDRLITVSHSLSMTLSHEKR